MSNSGPVANWAIAEIKVSPDGRTVVIEAATDRPELPALGDGPDTPDAA